MKALYKVRVGYGVIDSYVDLTAYEVAVGAVHSAGDYYFNTTDSAYSFYTGSVWKRLGSGITASAPLSYDAPSDTISIPAASASVDGYLSQGDWSIFDGKLDAEIDPDSIHLNGDNSPSSSVSWGDQQLTGLNNVHFNADGVGTIGQAAAFASVYLQGLIYTCKAAGSVGNAIKLIYTGGNSGAAATVTSVVGPVITVNIEPSATMGSTVKTAIDGTPAAAAWVSVVVGTGLAQSVDAGTFLSGGLDIDFRPNAVYSKTSVSIGNLNTSFSETGTLYLGVGGVSLVGGVTSLLDINAGTITMNGTVVGIVEAFTGSIEIANDKTYTLDLYAAYGYTINELKIISSSGSCTASVKIDATPVTGISAVSVTNSIATGTGTATNVVAAGKKVTLTLSANAAALDVAFTLKVTRS